MKRRQFLQTLGATGASSWLAACARTFQLPMSAMVGPTPVDSTRVGSEWDRRDPEGHWREATAYARWTPSPHNIQPWRVRVVSQDRAELYVDPARRLPNTDITSAFTLMSLAMFAEHCAIALAPRGVRVHTVFDEAPLAYGSSRLQRVALMELSRDAAIDVARASAERDLLLQRKTSRLPYNGVAIDDGFLCELAAMSDSAGYTLQWSHEPARVQQVLQLNKRALFEDLNDDVSRTELRQWIRPTDAEAEAKRDGLWAHCLRYPGWLLRDFFDQHEQWARGINADLCGRLLMRGMRGTRTVAWWSGPFESPRDWIAAGQLMGRHWLAMTKAGVHLHPFGSVVTNPRAHASLLSQLGADAPRNTLWLLARLGHSDRPPRSYRLDTPSIFVTDSEVA